MGRCIESPSQPNPHPVQPELPFELPPGTPPARATAWAPERLADSTEGEVRTFRPAAELRELFLSRGIAPTDSIVLYCNVGARAAHELFVLHLLGYDTLRLYLGSWRDWGERDDLPLAR